jgi:hypothetical protein
VGIDYQRIYENVAPVADISKIHHPEFYMNLASSREDLHQLLAGAQVRPDIGHKEEAYQSLTSAILAKKPETNFVLRFDRERRLLVAVYDATTGDEINIATPKC